MPSLDGSVADWMRRHRSTASNERLAAFGMSESQRRRLVGAGVIERVVTGAYRFVGVETDEMMRCAALCASRPELVIAGPTAGRYWKFPRTPRDELVHVLASPHSQPCREPWVRPYRTPLIDPEDVIVRIDGTRITTASRTVVDLTRYLDDESLATLIEHVLSKGVCTIASLRRCAERLNTPGRHWVRRFLRVLESRLPGAPRESSWELRVHNALVTRGITDLESQVWHAIPGHGPARFDFAIPSLQMVIEVDVHPEHRTPGGRTNDIRRDRKSRRVGWAVERLGDEELRTDFDAAIDDVVEAVRLRRAEVSRLDAAGLWPPPAL